MGGANSFYAILAVCGFLSAVWAAAKLARLLSVSSIVLEMATGMILSPVVIGLLPEEYSVCEHSKFDSGKCEEEDKGQLYIAEQGYTYCDCEAYEAADLLTEGWSCDTHSGVWTDTTARRLLDVDDGFHRHPDHERLTAKAARKLNRRLASSSHEGETEYDNYGECLEKNCEQVLAEHCAETPEIFSLAGQMGVALMIFESGMHFDYEKGYKVGGRAVLIAIVGTVGPLVTGALLSLAFGYDFRYDGIAVGTALAPTSVGIALKLLHEARQLQTDHGQIIITAAFVDDILSLILFNLVFSLADGFDLMNVVIKPVLGVVFMILAASLGKSFWPWVFAKIENEVDKFEEFNSESKVQEMLLRFSSLEVKDAIVFLCQMILLVGYAVITNLCGTHLWGCFIAGMSFAQVDHAHHIWVCQTKRLTVWMLRLFFACSVAFTIPLDQLFNVKAVWQGSILGLGPCILTKVLCGVFMGPSRWVIGWAMVGRAEFAYLIAQMAFASNMMEADVYSMTIWALLWATIAAPFIFRKVLEMYGKAHLTPPTDEEEEAMFNDPAYMKIAEGLTDLYTTPTPRRSVSTLRTLSGNSIGSRQMSGGRQMSGSRQMSANRHETIPERNATAEVGVQTIGEQGQAGEGEINSDAAGSVHL